jgi:hypothetical protein
MSDETQEIIVVAPSHQQLLEYADLIGYENMEPEFRELYNMYIEIEAHTPVALAVMAGLVLGYVLHKLGLIK